MLLDKNELLHEVINESFRRDILYRSCNCLLVIAKQRFLCVL
jgi:hypothetical protein